MKDYIEISLTLIITNISEKGLYLIQIAYDHTNEIEMDGIAPINRKKLKSGEQFKQEIKATVNNIDSRCVLAVI